MKEPPQEDVDNEELLSLAGSFKELLSQSCVSVVLAGYLRNDSGID